MRSFLAAICIAAPLLLAACGGGDSSPPATNVPAGVENPRGTNTTVPVASPAAAASSTATPAARPAAVQLKPSIEEALSCRVPPKSPSPGGAGNAPLQRADIDQQLFPNASCNDGTPAVLMFRPYEGEASRDKWIVMLSGGGGCSTAQECADRWCGVGTNFDADNMSTANAGNGAPGDGILRRQPGNPFANWNQVLVRYCTSDEWAGRALGVTLSASDPATKTAVTYQINFSGAYVYDALLKTLRRDAGTKPLVYRTGKELPDLDDASEVVFAGGSAGGAGVVFNLDRFADALKGGKNRPVVRGLIDSIATPERAKLGFRESESCRNSGLCSYEAALKAVAAARIEPAGAAERWTDESCLAWHQQNEPATAFQCFDLQHVLAHHVSTPYFVRMGLTDQLLSSLLIDAGLTAPDGKRLTLLSFGTLTREWLLTLPGTVLSGHEKAAMTKAPGVFAPSCREHYTLLNNATVYNVAVLEGGKPYSFFDVWNNWVAGQAPDRVVTTDARSDKC